MIRFLSAMMMVLMLGAGVVAADDAAKMKGPPWHLVDLWWDMGKEHPLERYSLTVTLDKDLPPETRLYIAPLGLAYLNGTHCYGGMQTKSDGTSKQEPHLRGIGPGLLFSMWGERSLDAIRPSDGGVYQSSGHEGDFVSARRAYPWTKGTYTYWIAPMDKQMVDGKPHTWVGAYLYNHQKDENIFIGALRFPGENLVLGRRAASFVEIYGPQIPLEQIPKVEITFGDLKVNGEAIASPGAAAQYNPGVPDYGDAVARDGRVVVKIGQPVANRTQKHMNLLPEKK